MKTIVAVNAKGGVGKSTCTVYLAEAFAQMGRKVLVCDLDPAEASFDVLQFANHKSPSIRAIRRSTVTPADFKPDYRILDTVGNSELNGVLKPLASLRPDLFVIPTGASTFDLRQLTFTLAAVGGAFAYAQKRILWCRIQSNTRMTRPEVLKNYTALVRTDSMDTIIPHSVHFAQMERALTGLPEDRKQVWLNLAAEIETLFGAADPADTQ